MSDETLNLLIGLGIAVLTAALTYYRTTTHYQQHMPWIAKRVMDVIIFASSRTQQRFVVPTKLQNAENGGEYDLTPEQAQSAMEQTKQHVYVTAKELNLERALPPAPILEAKIEQVVSQRKAAQRGPAGKGR
jgi:hypothetical protein